MISFLKTWIEQLAIAVVIASLFELIIPKGNLKKYIKIVLGLYVVFSIISPFVNSNALYDIKEDFKIKNEITENQIATNQKSMDNRLQVLYVDGLKKDITKKIEENGYKVQSINVDANLNADGVDPGIHKIYLSLTKKQIGIEDVNKVEINVNNKKTEKGEENEDIKKIKNILAQTYEISEEIISIKIK